MTTPCEGRLSCGPVEYQIDVTDRFGLAPVGLLDGVTSISWGRTLDDTSEATVVLSAVSAECCDALSVIGAWCHELRIVRNGELVWSGPIVQKVHEDETVTITARDVTAWLDVRVVRTTRTETADSSEVARRIIVEALEVDDPNVLEFLDVRPTAVTATRELVAFEQTAGDALRDLASSGLDYTALGRRIVLAGETTELTRLATLTDDDFVGTGIQIIEDGLQATTRAYVKGEGYVESFGEEGGCGLLERIVTRDTIVDRAEAQAFARAIVESSDPTPVYLEVPAGSTLAPTAPVCMADLVPGAAVAVFASRTCFQLQAELRLTTVEVGFSAGEETVGVTLAPVGFRGIEE